MTSVAAPKYLDAKALANVARLEVRARLLVEGFLTGQHRSPYHGVAIEFAGHREYVPGDDLKHVDWKVWSKTDRLYIKQYEEETNLGCQLVIDASRSMGYGNQSSPAWSKFDHAATAAAALAYLLNQQHDAVGLVTFDTQIGRQLPASAHPAHLRRLLHELEQVTPAAETDVSRLFLDLADAVQRRGIVALFSDLFLDRQTLKQCLRQFRSRKQEVIVFHVLHGDELTFPFEDTTLFRDLEQTRELQTNPRSLRRAYLDVFQNYLAEVQRICGAEGVDYVRLSTAEPLDAALAAYLSLRSRLRKRM
jgi:uncharacterized protein (DUF58 family)